MKDPEIKVIGNVIKIKDNFVKLDNLIAICPGSDNFFTKSNSCTIKFVFGNNVCFCDGEFSDKDNAVNYIGKYLIHLLDREKIHENKVDID